MSSQQRVLAALRDAREKLEAAERRSSEPIAVIGMGCRLPGGVQSADDYWELLRLGIDAVTEVPADRWDSERYYDPDPDADGMMYTKAGGFLDRLDEFDPQFFRVSPREAVSMDPQQRLLLEVVWEALEHAGQAPDKLRGSQTGIFAGLSWHDYERLVFGIDPERLDAYAGMGNTQSIAIGRLAFFLGSHGPATLLDTACSASLVSVHYACQSLRTGESDMALAGGVNLMISPMSTLFCCKIKALSPTGLCHTFDNAADGYVRGEGCGIVVLKRLSDAQRDGDNILAIIRGSAVNHDGPSSGLTVPNRRSQELVIRSALASGKVDPLSVDYIEAHGTGTSLGDPIEVGALGDALGKGRTSDRPLLIGSAKTNFGHLEAAAGIAGFMKVVLAVHHGQIPPHLNFHEPNVNIDWDAYPVEVVTKGRPWPQQSRVAGVSSFGFSGTNAHVVLDRAPAPALSKSEAAPRPSHVLRLSARDETALEQLAERYVQRLEALPEAQLADACYTANVGRAHFDHRLSVEGADAQALIKGLSALGKGRTPPNASRGKANEQHARVAVLFTGQGAQYAGMGRELYDTQPVFRQALDQCDAILRERTDIRLIEALFNEQDGDALNQTGLTQPALFCIEYALWQLWQSWGLRAHAVMGHSVGEYVAACVAGVWSLEDALALIAERGRLMQALPAGGTMASVFSDEATVKAAIAKDGNRVDIAAINSPGQTVISGPIEPVEAVLALLSEDGIKGQTLSVSHAFHSSLMEPMLDAFEAFVGAREARQPQLEVVSNVTGALADEALTTAAYWRDHVRGAVRFADGVQALVAAGYRTFLELGPQPVLTGLGRASVDDADCAWLSSLRRGKPETAMVLRGLGGMYTRGVEIDWAAFDAPWPRQRISMPTYPFQRERFWVETDASQAPLAATPKSSGLLGRRVHSAAFGDDHVVYETQLHPDSPTYLRDHQVFGQCVPPATLYWAMALEAGRAQAGDGPLTIENGVIHQPLVLDETPRAVQCVLRATAHREFTFKIASQEAEANRWTTHATGMINATRGIYSVKVAAQEGIEPPEWHPVDVAQAYQTFAEQDLELGAAFQVFETLARKDGRIAATVRLPQPDADGVFHPALLDACGQALSAAIPPGNSDDLYLPVAIDQVHVNGDVRGPLSIRGVLREGEEDTAEFRVADFNVYDVDDRHVATLSGATTRRATRSSLLAGSAATRAALRYRLQWEPADDDAETREAASRPQIVFARRDQQDDPVTATLTKADDQRHVVWRDMDTAQSNAFQEALSKWAGDDTTPGDVVYLWSLGIGASSDDDLQTDIRDVSIELTRLVQGMVAAELSRPCRLWIVTRGTQDVIDGDMTSSDGLVAASVWPLGRVIAMEHPDLRCTLIDLQASPRDDDAQQVMAQLADDGAETQTAWRDGQLRVARLVNDFADGDDASVPIEAEGRYLITGGLSGVGLRAAEWLVEKGARHLGLMSRRKPDQHASEVIERLRAVGVHVGVHSGDVTSFADVQLAVKGNENVPSPLKGIIHAAGVLEDGTLLMQDAPQFDRVLAPKVRGTKNLERASAEIDLDFFICFSSAASILGSAGQGNYAVANGFMDTLMACRRARGLPGLAINWGPWAEVGMAADMDDRGQHRMHQQGWDPLSPDTGFAILDDLLASDHTPVAVLPLDWKRFLQQFPSGQVPRIFIATGGYPDPSSGDGQAGGAMLTKIAEAAPDDRREHLVTYLRERVAATIGLSASEPPDPDQALSALGMDSLMHMELRNAITSELQLDVAMAEFLARPNIRELADLLYSKLAVAGIAMDGSVEDDGDVEEITL